MSPLRIKLCGVRTVEDALLGAEAGADEIGVIFAARSKRRVDLGTAQAIRAALPLSLPVIGVFLDAPLDEVLGTVREAGLQAAQLHGAWPAGEYDGIPLYAALQVTGAEPPSKVVLSMGCCRSSSSKIQLPTITSACPFTSKSDADKPCMQ